MSQFTSVIFDADGVVNTGELMDLTSFGISPETVNPFFRGPFQECLLGNADVRDLLPPYLQKWGWKGTLDDFLNHWFSSGHVLHTVVIESIRTLRSHGIRTYLATNQEKNRFAYMKEHMGYHELFDDFFVSCEMKRKKPDTEFFSAILEKLEVDPAKIIYWDDMSNNITAASELGIVSHLFVSHEDYMQQMHSYFPDWL